MNPMAYGSMRMLRRGPIATAIHATSRWYSFIPCSNHGRRPYYFYFYSQIMGGARTSTPFTTFHSASNPFDPVPYHSGPELLPSSALSSSLCLSLSSRFSLRSSLLSPRGRPFSVPSRHSGTEPLPPSTLSSSSCLSLSSRFSLRSSLFSPRDRPFSVPSRHSGTQLERPST